VFVIIFFLREKD